MRRAGLDPSDSDVSQPTRKALVEHVNDRIYSAWFSWEWRFIENLELRAWRQYWVLSNTYNSGDEVFYAHSSDVTDPLNAYYEAIQNVPASTAITNTLYWTILNPLEDIYLQYNQPGQNLIGQVVEIYKDDPRTDHHSRTLDFQPSTVGIDISYRHHPGIPQQVWVKFKIPPPVFTVIPFVTGKTYNVGDIAFNVTDGNCYVKITAVSTSPPSADWSLIVFPERFQRYVTAGAYADLLRDMEKGVTDPSPKLALAQAADAEAVNSLLREIDIELAQGQKMYLSIRERRNRRRTHQAHDAIPTI